LPALSNFCAGASKFATEEYQRLPRIRRTPRSLRAQVIASSQSACALNSPYQGEQVCRKRVGGLHERFAPKHACRGNVARVAEGRALRLLATSAALVRSEISRRSFSASAA